jgi:ABC-2 type transport system permease protein
VGEGWVGGALAELAVYRRLVGARVRGEMQYRASFLLQIVGNLGLHLTELAAIFILFRHFEALGGWRPGEIAFLYGISAVSFGTAHTFGSGFSYVSQLVLRGDFDRLLVRPVGTMVQVLAADVQLRRIGKVLQGLAGFAIAAHLIDVPWTVGRALYLPVVILSATLLFAALFALEATLCFWTTEGTEAVNAFTFGGSQLALYPIHIFETWLRRLFLWAIPLGFVVYAPALYLLDKPDPLGLPHVTRFLAPVAAAAFAVAAGALWRIGVRHYRSTGT